MLKVKQMSVNAFWKGEVEVKACTEDQGQDYVVRILGKGSFIKESSCSCREDREKPCVRISAPCGMLISGQEKRLAKKKTCYGLYFPGSADNDSGIHQP